MIGLGNEAGLTRHFHIADLFEMVAEAVPDRLAIQSNDKALTYAELDRRTDALARGLAARGLGRGDHVGLYMRNRSEYLESYLAAIKLGAFGVLLPVYATVAHRMFPFFAGNVVAGYRVWRPLWLLAVYGFNESGAVQSASAIDGIIMTAVWIPIALAAISMVIIQVYPISDKHVTDINRQLDEIRV